VRRRLLIIQDLEEIAGNVAVTAARTPSTARSELGKQPDRRRRSPESQPTSDRKQAKHREVTGMDAMGGGNCEQHDTVRNGLQNNQTNGQHNQHKGQDLALRATARRGLHRIKRSETVERLVGEVCD
jgi:hypothetical protein